MAKRKEKPATAAPLSHAEWDELWDALNKLSPAKLDVSRKYLLRVRDGMSDTKAERLARSELAEVRAAARVVPATTPMDGKRPARRVGGAP